MSLTTYSRPGEYDPKQLRAEIEQAIGPNPVSITSDGRVSFADPLDVSLETALYGVMDAHTIDVLAKAKRAKDKQIDMRTDQLIAGGFMYAGKAFSLTLEAQMKMVGIYSVKDHPALTYPIRWNSLDDTTYHDMADAADLEGFYLTGLSTMRGYVDSGTALKDLVRDADSVEAVEDIEDNR